MKRHRTYLRTLSLALSCSLLANMLSIPIAQAAPGEAKRAAKRAAVQAEIGELPNKPPSTKLELKSKRTKYSTRFLNPDGSFTEEIYLEPKFYRDPSDKQWKPINNNLKASAAYTDRLENTANDFKARFAEETGTRDIVTVEKDGKSLSLTPVEARKVQGVSSGDKVTYPGIFPQADLRYQVKGGGVKEDIILHSKPAQSEFRFEIKMNGLNPAVEKDGTIVFEDAKGQNLWYLDKPYMIDAKGTFSDDVTLELVQENGKTYVDVQPDETFLSQAQYPVTIDPSIDNWDVQRDMFVASAFPTSSYTSNTYMHTGYNSYFGATRSLVQFYLPALPSEAKISSATFHAFQTQADATNVSVDLFRVTSSWTTSATWNNQPSIAAAAETTTTSNAVNTYWQWTITQLVKDWYNGVQPNYGFMLKQQNENTSPYRTFTTVNNGANTPRLTIHYTVDPAGLEDFWAYTKDNVNPANGNLVLQDTDVSIPGRGVPVTVTRTYNSRKSGVAGVLFGYGWVSNLETRLVDAGTGPITLIDPDGTRHIFGQRVGGGGYVAHPGVYLDLVKNPDNTYTITQVDGTRINFNTSGFVSSIVDTNGNTTTYTYGTNGKISTIRDASGRTTAFAYGTNGYVSSITDPANRVTRFEYDAAGNLKKVIDPEQKETIYSYDGTHNLTGITDARNITTTIGYDTAIDRVQTVSRPITINGTQQTSTTTYTYDTTYLVTTVTDGEGRRVDYSYNANGNVVQITENPIDPNTKAITYFAYDNNNNLTQVKDPNTVQANGSEVFQYTYDEKGNITSVKLPGSQQAVYSYDGQSNLVEARDFKNNLSTFDYDSSNNQTEAIDPNVQARAQRYATNGNLLYATHPMSAADNQVTNSSFETDANADNWPDQWTQAIENGKTATISWSTTSKYGKKAVSISNPTGWAIVYSNQMITYVPGQSYVVSGYVKTSGATNTALVKLEFFDSANNWLGQQVLYSIKGTHDWTRLMTVVDSVPANTTKIRVAVGMNAGSGTAYFDGIQLEKGTVLSAYNLVENSSFERDTDVDNKPDGWTDSGNLSVNDKLVQDQGNDNVYVGTYSFQMTGEAGKNKFIKQRIPLSGDANMRLTLSGWSKQVGANPNGGYYHLQVAINHTDGTVDWSNAHDFSKTASDWQHVAAEVKPTKAFESVEVYYYYYNQTGTAWFDAMRLEIGASHTFNTYDANGNYVTSVKDPLGNTVSYGYDAAGNRTSITDAKNKTTSFAYDGRGLLTSVTDPNLKTTSYGYDAAGNRTRVTDAKNQTTTYEYNELNQVSNITNPLNQSIQFGYDKNGNTTKIIFPKGDTVSYTYNGLNRMDGIYYNGVKQWGLGYDRNGNVTSVTHTPTGKTTTYTYDKNNRLTKEGGGHNQPNRVCL